MGTTMLHSKIIYTALLVLTVSTSCVQADVVFDGEISELQDDANSYYDTSSNRVWKKYTFRYKTGDRKLIHYTGYDRQKQEYINLQKEYDLRNVTIEAPSKEFDLDKD